MWRGVGLRRSRCRREGGVHRKKEMEVGERSTFCIDVIYELMKICYSQGKLVMPQA